MHGDRAIAEAIAKARGESISSLGLRFDRVVVRVLTDLRRYAADKIPAGATVILTLTAPIRTPAKTISGLEELIATLVRSGLRGRDQSADVCGNAVRLRLVKHAPSHAHPLIGFVHNRDIDSRHLLDLAEQWLRPGDS